MKDEYAQLIVEELRAIKKNLETLADNVGSLDMGLAEITDAINEQKRKRGQE